MENNKAAAETTASSWAERIKGSVPLEYREDFIDKKIETNLTRTLMLSVFIIAVQVFLNILNILKPASDSGGGGEADVMKYVVLSLVTLSVGIVYLIISLVVKRGHLKNRTFRRILPFSLLYLYCVIQMIFLSFNVGSEAGMNSYIIALILVGFFVIMSPLLNIISIVVLFASAFIILYTAGAASGVFNIIMVTDSWANILIITLIVIFMANATYNMYRNNFLNSKRLEVSNERLDLLAKTDSLTELYNRWGFYEYIDNFWSDYVMRPGTVSVFMFDLDYFKEYNDTYGHLAGDDALRIVARSVCQFYTPENEGIVCRFGGEEFLCLARLDSPGAAFQLAEDVRKSVESAGMGISEDGRGSVTISGGVVTCAGGAPIELDELISQADTALYDSKDRGRNQIRVYGEKTSS